MMRNTKNFFSSHERVKTNKNVIPRVKFSYNVFEKEIVYLMKTPINSSIEQIYVQAQMQTKGKIYVPQIFYSDCITPYTISKNSFS